MTARLILSAVFVPSLLLLGSAAGAQPPAEAAAPEAPKAERLLEDIERLRLEYRVLEKEETKHEGEEQTLIVLEMRRKVFELMRTVNELVAEVVRQKEEGVKRPSGLKQTRKLLLDMDRTIPAYIDKLEMQADMIRTALAEAPQESHDDLVIQIQEVDEILDDAYPFFFEYLEHRESLGLQGGNGRSRLKQRARARASMLAGRLDLVSARRREVREEAERSPDDAAFQAEIGEADEALDDVASSLWAICDVMDDLGLDTAEYRQVLIRATGEITGDVLDVDVAIGLFDEAVDALSDWLERRGPMILARVTLFFAILVLFWMLARVTRWLVSRLTARAEHVTELSRRILVGVASRTVLALGVFIALAQVGVDVTALLAGLGIVGFIVGFALQTTLGNFASGAMILLYRPFDVGDVIEAGGVFGTVDGMSLVSTTILTFDNQTMVVPNSKIWGDVIRNVMARDIRRVDLEFGFSHAVDVARAEKVLASILSEHPQITRGSGASGQGPQAHRPHHADRRAALGQARRLLAGLLGPHARGQAPARARGHTGGPHDKRGAGLWRIV